MLGEPVRGWRHGPVPQRHTKRDWAWCIREWLEVSYPEAVTIHGVLDHVNTHPGAALEEPFPPATARRLLDRLGFPYPPKHASGLNRAESEMGVLNRPWLNRRIDHAQTRAAEIAAWEAKRNADAVQLHWTFTRSVARAKRRKLYPSIED